MSIAPSLSPQNIYPKNDNGESNLRPDDER